MSWQEQSPNTTLKTKTQAKTQRNLGGGVVCQLEVNKGVVYSVHLGGSVLSSLSGSVV